MLRPGIYIIFNNFCSFSSVPPLLLTLPPSLKLLFFTLRFQPLQYFPRLFIICCSPTDVGEKSITNNHPHIIAYLFCVRQNCPVIDSIWQVVNKLIDKTSKDSIYCLGNRYLCGFRLSSQNIYKFTKQSFVTDTKLSKVLQ